MAVKENITSCKKCCNPLAEAGVQLCNLCISEDSDSQASSGTRTRSKSNTRSSPINITSYPGKSDLERRIENLKAKLAEQELIRKKADAEINRLRAKSAAILQEIALLLEASKRKQNEYLKQKLALDKLKAMELAQKEFINKELTNKEIERIRGINQLQLNESINQLQESMRQSHQILEKMNEEFRITQESIRTREFSNSPNNSLTLGFSHQKSLTNSQVWGLAQQWDQVATNNFRSLAKSFK